MPKVPKDDPTMRYVMMSFVQRAICIAASVAISTVFIKPVEAGEPVSAYPSRQVRLIVPYPPGGSNDIVARIMAAKLSERWKQTVIVENKVGASGILASEYVANLPPDGYAILVGSNSATTVAEHMKLKTPGFKGIRDLTPLTNVLSIPAVLVANPKFPANNFTELLDVLKKNPGQIAYSHSGTNSGYNLSMLQFQTLTGTKLIGVPYGGLAPAEIAVMAGDTQIMLDSTLSSLNYIKSGQMKVIGLASLEPWPQAPQYPLLSKFLPGFQSLSFIGLFGPRGMAPDLADKVTEEFRSMFSDPDMRKRLLDLGALPSTIGMSRADFKTFLEEDSKTWGEVFRASNLSVEQ